MLHSPDRRARRAALSSVAAIGARLGAAATSIITVPVLLTYLGLERYGLWVTAAAVTAWIGIGHLGIAPSLLNRLAATEPADHGRRAAVVASAWWLSVLLGAGAVFLLVLADAAGVWGAVFNVQVGPLPGEARAIAIVMWIGVAASMPLAVPLTVVRADQAGYYASITELVANLARLVAIVAAVLLDVGIGGVAASAVASSVLVSAAAGMLVFGRRVAWPRPSFASRRTARSLVATGIGFTGMALAGLLISSTDVIVITQVLGPASVPPYAVAFALLALFVSLEMAVLDSMWPAYAEAAARGDRHWVRVANRNITGLLVAASATFSVGLVLVGGEFIRLWAGPEAVPPPWLLVTLAGIAMIQSVLLPHGRALTALGHVRRNTMLSLTGAAINLPVSIVLAGILGITGVALGTLAAYLVTGVFVVRSARQAIARVGLSTLATAPR